VQTLKSFLFAIAGAALALSSAGAGEVWYVAPNGNDESPGNAAHPFATLERARDAMRKKRTQNTENEPVTVWLAPGTYRLSKSLELGRKDSGAEGAEVVWRAAAPGKTRISGGMAPKDWHPVRDPALLKRLDEKARRHVLRTNLKKQGVADFGTPARSPVELFFGDRAMTPARWPNGGWAKIGKLPDGKEGLRFRTDVDTDRLVRWAGAGDPWAFGYWFHLWSFSEIPIAKVDPAKREITLAKKHHYGLKTGKLFYVTNLLEELDRPGEWYLDRKSGDLFFWPPEGPPGTRPVVSVLKSPLVRLRDASHVVFRGLVFTEARGDAVAIQDGADCRIEDCTVRNTGGTGIVVNGGRRHKIIRCEVTQTGAAAISMSGGDRKTLKKCGHEVLDCDLHHYARTKRTYQPAVGLQGVGCRVAHCHIHHAPHVGILFKGNEHVMEYNDVHDVCQETDDAGAFYTGRDWTLRGNVIQFNHFHSIGDTKHDSLGTHQVYLDDCASGIAVRSNFFEGGYRTILVGGGRDNIIEGNLFIGGNMAVWFDARGAEGRNHDIVPGGAWHMLSRLRAVPYDKPPWSTRYPSLANILENNPNAPVGNRVEHNVFVGGKPFGLRIKDPKLKALLDIKNNWIGKNDPGFVNRKARDFRLRPNSPARACGYKDIPFEKIGPR
jgi:hypothetical protein